MQEHSSSASQVLLDFLKVLAVPIAGGVGYLLSWFRNRRKLRPELSILEANAAKTEAEARKLDGETVDRAYDRIDELVKVNYQLRQDCLALQRQVDMAELRERLYEENRRATKARLVLNEAASSALDDPKSLTEPD